MLVFAVAWTTIMPLTETVAMGGVRAAGLDYGRMRLWGSLSFIAASFCGGWAVERLGAGSVIWLIVVGGALMTVAAHALERPIGLGRHETATRQPRLELSGALPLLSSRAFLLLLVAGGAVQAAHAVLYTFSTLHWRAQGLSAELCGLLWAISVVAEIGLFAFSGAVVKRVGAMQLVGLGAAAAIVRWTAMGFDPPLALLVSLQILQNSHSAPRTSAPCISWRGPCQRGRPAQRKPSMPPSPAASPWAAPSCSPVLSTPSSAAAPTGRWLCWRPSVSLPLSRSGLGRCRAQ